jgi:hypothetical protein
VLCTRLDRPGVPGLPASRCAEWAASVDAERNLMLRGLIRPGGLVDPAVVSTLLPCTRPNVVLTLDHSPGTALPLVWRGYLSQGACVQIEVEQSQYHLRQVGDQHKLLAQLFAHLGVAGAPSPPALGGMVPLGLFSIDGLAGSHLDLQTRTVLSDALTDPLSRSTLTVMMPKSGGWEVDKLGFLLGRQGLWLLRFVHRPGGESVKLIPCTGSAAQANLSDMLGSLLPEKSPCTFSAWT